MKKLKTKAILFVTPEFPLHEKNSGGLATYIRNISKILYSQGFHTHIAVPAPKNNLLMTPFGLVHQIKSSDFNFPIALRWLNHIPLRLFNELIRSWHFAKVIKAVIIDNDISIVQFTNYKFLGFFFKPIHKTKTITRLSSLHIPWMLGQGRKITFYDKIVAQLERRQLSASNIVFSPSNRLTEIVSKWGIECKTIGSPLPEVVKKPKPFDFSKKTYKLLYFGILNRMKGIDILFDSLHILDKNRNLPNIVIDIVGRDDPDPILEQKMSEYLNSIAFHNIKVFISPPLQTNDLISKIQACYMVILPSRIDNQPNAALESLSQGKPIITSTNSSIDELIASNNCGEIFTNESAQSLADTILKSISYTQNEYEETCEHVIKHAHNLSQKHRSEHLALYNQLTEDNTHGY